MTSDSLRALLDAAGKATPFAWATFDGEGSYDLRLYDDNEQYREQFIARNGERYATWVKPLFDSTAASPDVVAALARIALAAVQWYNSDDAYIETLPTALRDAGLLTAPQEPQP